MPAPFPLPDGQPIRMRPYASRATVRLLRLHACGGLRLAGTTGVAPKWLKLLDRAERYADGELTDAEFAEVCRSAARGRQPPGWRVDIAFALRTDDRLSEGWAGSVERDRTIRPDDGDYPYALPRLRVFEELVGPDPLPAFRPEWRTDTVLALAKQMYDAREFSAAPILADALQDAGADCEPLLAHLRDGSPLLAGPHGQPRPSPLRHLRGCWATDLVLGKR